VVKSQFNNPKTIGELLKEGEGSLSRTSMSPRLDSEVLLAHALGTSRSGLLARLRDVSDDDSAARFFAFVDRRSRGEPVAYITGEREFYGLSFAVSPAVLVPRPETELIVDEAVKFLTKREQAHLLDLGTGSGCIGISIVRELVRRGCKDVLCDAVDSSPEALHVARQNAQRLGVEKRLSFVQSDWCANRSQLSPLYDCIVANPPYIDHDEKTPVELSYEPQGALFSAENGLSDARRILREAVPLLAPGGLLLCEVGAGKRMLLQHLVEPHRECCEITYLGDASVADRFCVVALTKRS